MMNYSLKSYRLIIERALASGRTFVPFTLESKPAPDQIYLRHDVDYSLEMALELAQVNADLGIRGTFCVLLRSQIYNVLSQWSQRLVQKIYELGQRIALHATLIDQAASADQTEAELRADFDFACHNLPMMSPVFSWHNPTPEVLERDLQSERVAGLINAYAARFTKEIGYFSDSNMRNSVEDFLALFSGERPGALQLLFHPFNWVAGGRNMGEIFAGTWPYVIREREYEMRLNSFYHKRMPEGLPTALLQNFAAQWYQAAESTHDAV